MALSVREDKIWSYGWLLFGLPAMIAGFVQGYRHDNLGTMTGTIIVAVIVIVTNIPILRSKP